MTVTVLDQYGDPFEGTDVVTLISPEDSEDGAYFTFSPAVDADTDNLGETDIDVIAASHTEEDSYDIIIATSTDEDDKIGEFTVEYAVAGDVESYEFRVVEGPEIADGKATIDGYDDENDEIELRLVGLDEDGKVAVIFDENDGIASIGYNGTNDIFDVVLEGDNEALEGDAIDSITYGVIKLVADQNGETGTVTLKAKDGALTEASVEIEVIFTAPELTGIELVEDAEIEIKEGEAITIMEDGEAGDYELNEIVKVLGIEDAEQKCRNHSASRTYERTISLRSVRTARSPLPDLCFFRRSPGPVNPGTTGKNSSFHRPG